MSSQVVQSESPKVTAIYPELIGAKITRSEKINIHGNYIITGEDTFKEIPDTRKKYFSKGKMYDYFESIVDFRESDKVMCIIPLYCVSRKNKGKRYFVELMDAMNYSIKLFNVERYNDQWVNNEHNDRNIRSPKQGIEICYPGDCYTFLIVKEPESVFGFRVVGVKS